MKWWEIVHNCDARATEREEHNVLSGETKNMASLNGKCIHRGQRCVHDSLQRISLTEASDEEANEKRTSSPIHGLRDMASKCTNAFRLRLRAPSEHNTIKDRKRNSRIFQFTHKIISDNRFSGYNPSPPLLTFYFRFWHRKLLSIRRLSGICATIERNLSTNRCECIATFEVQMQQASYSDFFAAFWPFSSHILLCILNNGAVRSNWRISAFNRPKEAEKKRNAFNSTDFLLVIFVFFFSSKFISSMDNFELSNWDCWANAELK